MPAFVAQTSPWQLRQLRTAVVAESAEWQLTASTGSLLLAFVAPPAIVRLTGVASEGAGKVDELLLRDLAREISSVGTPGVVAMIARPGGSRRRQDRRFALSLAATLAGGPTELVDLLTIDGNDVRSVLFPRQRVVVGLPAARG